MTSLTVTLVILKPTMRRLLSILLLAAFGLPVVAPVLALGQDLEANLPVCCRRNGTHHCGMMGMERDSGAPTFSARCSSFPQQSAPAPTLKRVAFIVTQPLLRLPLTTLTTPARAETQRRISRERSRQTRGPPTDTLL
jgi:hypothetical protein